MSGDCKQQPHIYYTEYGRKTLEEYYVNKIEALNEEVEELKGIVDYLESKVKPIIQSLRTMNSHLSNEELLARLTKLEGAVSNLMMRRPGHQEYEKTWSMLYATMKHDC